MIDNNQINIRGIIHTYTPIRMEMEGLMSDDNRELAIKFRRLRNVIIIVFRGSSIVVVHNM